MKTRFILMFMCLATALQAQLPLPYAQNFNAGVPANWWSQGFSGAPGWSVNGGVSTVTVSSTSGCDSRLYTPVFNTTGVPDPVVVYRIKVSPTDFCSPLLFLQYTIDGGSTYQSIASFGVDDNCATPGNFINPNQWYYYYSLLPSHQNLQIAFVAEYYFLGYGTMYLDDFEVRDLNAVGMAEPTAKDFVVFPNPATDYLRLSGVDESFSSYSLMNLMGAEVLKGVVPEDGIIAIGTLSPGCYLLSIRNDHEELVGMRKVVKQ